MRVELTVSRGSNAGKTFDVTVPQFVIGRAKGCQLRPQSDAISRQHCVICVGDDAATIRDLGSRNGTIVNGEKIDGKHTLNDGDELRVGPLHLTVGLREADLEETTAAPSDTDTKSLAVASEETRTVKPAKTAKAASDDSQLRAPAKISDSGDIGDWLNDEEDDTPATAKTVTRQFRLDDSERFQIKKAADDVEAEAEADKKSGKGKKKEPGKLPERKADVTADSREAAEATLKKMFQRGVQ